MAQNLTLKVSGLGHSLTLNVSPSATLGDVMKEVESKTSLPAGYQRLIGPGLKRTVDEDVTLESLGIQDRTKFLLLHSKNFADDQKGILAITEIQKEISQLEANMETEKPEVVHELVTRICCKLDGVDTNGSSILREMRKEAIMKAESLDPIPQSK